MRAWVGAVVAVVMLFAGVAVGQPSSDGPLAPPANGPRHADSTFVAIVDCTLHATPGASVEHATVVFRDGRIVAVMTAERTDDAHAAGHDAKGPIKAPEAPAGARVIDGRGLHVYPGFIDSYVEVDAPAPDGDPASLHWNKKVTPQRSALDGAGVDAATGESLRKLGFVAACISPRGGVFRGSSAVVSLAKPADEQSAAKPPVYREKVYQSVAFELGGGYPSSEMGAMALIRQTFIDADWQDEARRAGAVIAPNALDPLMPAYVSNENGKGGAYRSWGEVLFDTSDELEVLRAVKVCKEFQRPMVVLGSGSEFQRMEAIREACTLSERDGLVQRRSTEYPMEIPFVLPLDFPKAPDVSTYAKAEGVELSELMAWEQAPTNPRRMVQAGIKFALTTAKLSNRADFAGNLKTALKYGLKEDQALAALTTIPAEMLGVSDQLGTVETGKRADLIVADGPIFGEKTKIRTVFIDGVAHEISEAPVDLEGRWDLAVGGKPVEDHWLEIDKGNAVTVHLKDKSSKASKVVATAEKISFVFDHEPLDGKEGVWVISAVVEKDAGGKAARMNGQGLKADGEAFSWTATRRGPSLEGVWAVRFAPEHSHEDHALVVDKDGKATMWNAPKDTQGHAIQPDHVKIADGKISYDLDLSDVGGGTGGLVKDSGVVDFSKDPPVMVGELKTPDGNAYAWRAVRRAANPLVGAWRVIKIDGKDVDPKAEEGMTIDIGEKSVTLTLTRKKEGAEKPERIVVHGEDVKFDEDTLTFTHDLSKLGEEGKSSDTVKLRFGDEPKGDTLVGEGDEGEKGKHAYVAARKVDEPVEVASGLTMSKEEAERIKAVPEKLPVPFGPYGFLERPDQKTVVFTHAKVWTSGPQGVIEDGEVTISDGKVTDVRAQTSHVDPLDPKAVVIDCKGESITPGIVDCHSHTGISRGVNEGGQAVTAECRIADVTNPDAVDWYRQLAGGVTAVNSLHGSANAIGGQNQVNKLRWGCASPDDMHFAGAKPGIKFALGENPRQVNFGGGRRFGGDARYPASRMGVETLIRDRLTAAREYDREWKAWNGGAQAAAGMLRATPPELDERIEAVKQALKKTEEDAAKVEAGIAGLRKQMEELKASHASDSDLAIVTKALGQYETQRSQLSMTRNQLASRLDELQKECDAATGTGVAHASGKAPPRRDLELEALAEVLRGDRIIHCHSYRQDEILMLCEVAKDFGIKIGTFQHALEGYKVADYIRENTWGGASGFSDWWAYKVEVQDAIPAAFPIMHDVGVLVSYNSDSDELARRLNVEAGKAVKYGGLSEEEALKFVTINPAKQLQIDKWCGSIEVGKDADLAVWSGDPLSSLSRCVATYVDGRRLFSLAEDEAMRKTIAGERQRLIQKILGEGKTKQAEGDEGGGRGRGGFGRRRGPRPQEEDDDTP